MIKISLIVLSTLVFLGCESVDDAINNALSGDTTTETISTKEKVLIINNVSRTACVVMKNGLLDDDFKDAKTLVAQLGVNCASYGKTAGVVGEIGTMCVEQSLSEWLEEDDHSKIISIEDAQGENACVIGFNS